MPVMHPTRVSDDKNKNMKKFIFWLLQGILAVFFILISYVASKIIFSNIFHLTLEKFPTIYLLIPVGIFLILVLLDVLIVYAVKDKKFIKFLKDWLISDSAAVSAPSPAGSSAVLPFGVIPVGIPVNELKKMGLKEWILYFVFFILIVLCVLISVFILSRIVVYAIIYTGLFDEEKIPSSISLLAIIISFVILTFIYIKLAYRVLAPNEMGVINFQGIARKWIDSGPHLILYPFEGISIFPTDIIRINFDEASIMVNSGYEEELEANQEVYKAVGIGKKERTKLERLTVVLDSGVNIRFEVGPDLLKSLRYLPKSIWDPRVISSDKRSIGEKLKEHFTETNADVVRAVGAQHTWVELNDKKGEIIEEMRIMFIGKRIFKLSGFSEDMDYLITEVRLSDDMKKALESIEEARKNKVTTEVNADAAYYKRSLEIRANKEDGLAKAEVAAADVGLKIEAQLKAPKNAFNLSPQESINFTITTKTLDVLPSLELDFKNISLGENLGENIGKNLGSIFEYIREGMKIIKSEEKEEDKDKK